MGTENITKPSTVLDKKTDAVSSELEKFHLFYEQPAPIKKRSMRINRVIKRPLK